MLVKFDCFRCGAAEEYDRRPVQRPRIYCRKCLYQSKLLDNRLRQADRYHELRKLGCKSQTAGMLAKSSNEKYQLALAELRAQQERDHAE